MSEPQFTSWLSNRLDEVEETAKAAAQESRKEPEPNWHASYVDKFSGYVRRPPVDYSTARGDETLLRGLPGAVRFAATFDPATVLQLVAATRQLLELHERWELEEYEYTGNPIVTIENGVTYRHWPAGSITGQRQVGVRYECWHCINSDESHMDWPCPTLRAVAAGWGWVDE